VAETDVCNFNLHFLQSLHEKKMADNEKKFEIRLDQQKSEITAQVIHIWLIFSDYYANYVVPYAWIKQLS
jgi:hypothetical protein